MAEDESMTRLRSRSSEYIRLERDWNPGEKEMLALVIAGMVMQLGELNERRRLLQEEFQKADEVIQRKLKVTVKKSSTLRVVEDLECRVEYEGEERILVAPDGVEVSRRPMNVADKAEAAALAREK